MQPTRIQVMDIISGQTIYNGPMAKVAVMRNIKTGRNVMYIQGHAFADTKNLLILFWP